MSKVNVSILECVNFAAIKHSAQRRKDKEHTPYINHPIGVACLLLEAGITNEVVLQAALLHDTVEDTDTTNDELKLKFGEEVAAIVAEVTDNKELPAAERKKAQVQMAASSSYNAKLVKLADKIYNCSDLIRCLPEGWSESRGEAYLKWSAQVLDAGLRGVNDQLEMKLVDILSSKLPDWTRYPDGVENLDLKKSSSDEKNGEHPEKDEVPEEPATKKPKLSET